MPTDSAPSNHAGSISAASSMLQVRGLAVRHTSKSTLPFDDLRPQTKTTASNRPCELLQVLFAAGDLPADRVVDMHVGGIGRPAAHFGPQRFEQGDALGCLREEVHRAREVDLTEVRLPFDHDRLVGDLPRESDHFGVAPFSEDHDLPSGRAHPFVGLDDAGLQTGDYRAGGVDHFDAQFRGPCVGRRRLPVRPDEEPAAVRRGMSAWVTVLSPSFSSRCTSIRLWTMSPSE